MTEGMDLVIDADVMRSASEKEHPISSNSREVLEMIRNRGHRVVHSPKIFEEHRKHQSNFASKWRVSMIGRRQWCRCEVEEDSELRAGIREGHGEDEKREEAALKDAHLLEAAIRCDKRIISRDARALGLFRELCPTLGKYREILWADLTGMPTETLEWIGRDLPDEPEMRLC